jgi:hypothetical protein
LEFAVGDKVFLKISMMKGMMKGIVSFGSTGGAAQDTLDLM